MTETATRPTTGERAPWPPEEFVARLRAQGRATTTSTPSTGGWTPAS